MINSKLKQDFDDIMKDNTAGNPMKNIKWANKSTYSIAKSLKSKGYSICEDTVGRMLKEDKYSLQVKMASGLSIKPLSQT